MTIFKISLSLEQLAGVILSQVDRSLPAVHEAVAETTAAIQTEWQAAVFKAIPIRDAWSRTRNEEAVNSIKVTFSSPLSALVSSDNKDVVGVEEGFAAYDMKAMLLTSSKTKVTTKGKRYLTIPIRHGTPGNGALSRAMPQQVYQAASGLRPSSITGRNLWGDALPAGLVPKRKPSHRSDPYAGMVRMNTSTASAKSSVYLTFRTMSENSPASSWILPAKPGQNVARGIAEQARSTFSARVCDVIRQYGA